jgi:(E)-4-hydroxy-3-methylbut-2-enyl-diphosphate synthase
MTNTDTLDTKSSVEQCIRIFREGADFVRLTVRNTKEAENLRNIKNELRKRGFLKPLVADVHFNPRIAEISAGIVEKVRINPGNYDSENFKEMFISLLRICKKNNTAIRIGVNHGSLSERIMEKFGDTPEGMVESAMEYLRLCQDENFINAVVSVKSSNTRLMIWANRLLVKTMMEEGMNFPVHLGITEAGDGEDGRLRSAVGIGTLLGEGIGDTIRISLTEDPEKEIPVAVKLVSIFENSRREPDKIPEWNKLLISHVKTDRILNVGDQQVPVVISSGYQSTVALPDYVFINSPDKELKPPEGSLNTSCLKYVQIPADETDKLKKSDYPVKTGQNVLVLQTGPDDLLSLFKGIRKYQKSGLTWPLIIRSLYTDTDPEMFLLKASSGLGRFFTDSLAEGIWLENPNLKPAEITRISFGLLQAARARISRTEYISCPSCGRTLFNIQETLAKVKAATSHLRHLKIAVMGCIVNGPGEMADADYGFVGSAPGKVTLFRNKEAVKKNIPSENAIDEMILLIKDRGDWRDP